MNDKLRSQNPRHRNAIKSFSLALLFIGAFFILPDSSGPLFSQQFDSEKWEDQISRIVWVAYSPTSANPTKGLEATLESAREDLIALRKTGFTGLVTYGSTGTIGRELTALAESLGFKGAILGVWDPKSKEEIVAAKAQAKSPILLGYCVGNEGLGKRYQLAELKRVIDDLRVTTGKPVTTTEEIDDYIDNELLDTGDWTFPNAHPYFHGVLDPDLAVEWTMGAFDEIKRRSKRPVIFKEVGLPTAGDSQGKLSEASQRRYYHGLSKTSVKFVYFEAFDQPWKTHLPVEPHWGILRSDRSPKLLAARLIGDDLSTTAKAGKGSPVGTERAFYVYKDADSPNNHFSPSGYMGDCGDIEIDEAYDKKPHSGKTCIKVVYLAKGRGPNNCDYTPPCKWAGAYWQQPQNNWGVDEALKDKGLNLSAYNRLRFWARANKRCTIEFKVGGIGQPFGDSLIYPRSKSCNLTNNWQEFEIDLGEADLRHIIGGFCWVTSWTNNPEGITFYLDDIRFEKM